MLTPSAPTPAAPPSHSLADWLATPAHAFRTWLDHHPISISPKPLAKSTRRVYLAMWQKFTQYLERNHLRLDQVKAAHVWDFLETACSNKLRDGHYHKLTGLAALTGTGLTDQCNPPTENRPKTSGHQSDA